MKDPDNKDFWIIDEEAAEVVRLIFRLFIGGKNRNQIAVYLTQEQFPTPTFYKMCIRDRHPFPDHPFQVREDASMQETAESVKEYGVLVPALARPREDGGYEPVSYTHLDVYKRQDLS